MTSTNAAHKQREEQMVTVYKQSDAKWHTQLVGDGTGEHDTFGFVGCMVTCLTMAQNQLLGTNDTPPQVNTTVKDAHGFTGANVLLPTAAAAVGLSAPEAQRIRGTLVDRNVDALRKLACETLDAGGVALLHVDHNNAGG